ncbi:MULTISPECIES: beta-ketoacyl-ACP synthase III [unclassified Polaribacter]|uniref:beta-ketoacyl-ACP synthase III n=1 Tax=unclassified Polaribacter TaxID=196858 RepID=UPI0011BED032|nr:MULTISPECIES: beta-ketoacyl-ACP synthase III [unclassified Polaribacter]TXD51361.1 ketoacyl-ACP synthase III [Polaribacter sp. IC063]TXD61995.1 ketoacyl-ACP synthase III [Polaribacter sp. IC066]
MTRISAAITAVGKYVPDYILTNKELETYVDTNDEWITSRTGIKERRILKGKGLGTSYMAIKAAEDLFQRSNLKAEDIDLVIVGTATPDLQVASTAAHVATEIGAVNAFAYDLQAACSSFLFGMSTAASYIESGRYKKILLIGADKMSSIIDYKDRATCIIFGDGAGAAIFEPNNEGLGLQDEYLRSDGIGRDFLRIEAGGSMMPTTLETVKEKRHFVYQEGKTVFKYAVSNMADVSEKMLTRNNLTEEDIQWLVPHQANKRIIEATAKRVGVAPEKVMMNIQNYGNTTSATLPLLLADYEDQLKKGDNLIFAAFGGGFTWGAIYLKWAYNSKK